MTDMDGEEGEEENESIKNLGSYEGDRNEKNERHGFGHATFSNGDSYEGQYQSGKRHGIGTYRFTNRASYTGDYVENRRHGRGIFVYPDGSKYEGDWHENLRHGHGIYTYPNKDIYEGQWSNHRRHGKGTYKSATTNVQYVGMWKEGQRHGPGELHYGQYRYVGKFHENDVCRHCSLRCPGEKRLTVLGLIPKGKGRFVFNNGYEQHGLYLSRRTAQTQCQWIPRDLVPSDDLKPMESLPTSSLSELLDKFQVGTLRELNVIPGPDEEILSTF